MRGELSRNKKSLQIQLNQAYLVLLNSYTILKIRLKNHSLSLFH